MIERTAPVDPVVRLSLAELLVHRVPLDRASMEEAAKLGEDASNDSAIHAITRSTTLDCQLCNRMNEPGHAIIERAPDRRSDE